MEGNLHKAPKSKDGVQRLPVALKSNGTTERLVLTPQFGGLMAVVDDEPIVFFLGKFASDAGFPKLRWIDP